MVLTVIRSFIRLIQKRPENESFGFQKDHPIPVNGIKGELEYLSFLRCPCNQPFMYHRLGAFSMESSIEQPGDCYELRCRSGAHHYFLYLAMYHDYTSHTAPRDLTLKNLGGIGYNFFIPEFDSLTFEQYQSKKFPGPKYLPNDPKCLLEIKENFDKGKKYLDAKDYPNAIKCFDDALRLDWQLDQAWFLKLRALVEQGNEDEARRWCEKGMILFSQNMFCLFCEELLKGNELTLK